MISAYLKRVAWRIRSKPIRQIACSDASACILCYGKLESEVKFAEVSAISAYKLDRLTYDPIVIVLWVGDNGVPFEELTPGFEELVSVVESKFGMAPSWRAKVNEGPFEAQNMELWRAQ